MVIVAIEIEKASYYLDNIENPIREISAHYYMANCYLNDQKKNEALFTTISSLKNLIIITILKL